jgi:outer membrane protein assembly factor BamA
LGYRVEVTKVDAGDVYFCVSSGVCDAPTLAALRKNQKLSPLALALATDKADDPFEPRRGYRARLDEEYASALTLSDFRYNRVSNEESLYLPLGRRSVLAGHLRLGYVNALGSTVGAGVDDAILHPRKRLYLGGAMSVRGFGENQLGPHVLTIAPEVLRGTGTQACPVTTLITQCDPNAAHVRNQDFDPRPIGGNQLVEGSVEYRFPVLGSFLGALFVDAGYLAQSTNPTLTRSAAAITPGFGVRYLSPAGPIRIDVGINPILSEKLPVVTQDGDSLVTLVQRRTYSTGTGLLSRLTLHLAIGEAY